MDILSCRSSDDRRWSFMGTANTYSISSPWRTPVQDGHGLVRDRCSKLYIKTGGEPLLARLNSWAYCTTGHLKAKSPPTTDDGNVMYVVIGNNCFYRMACYPWIYTASTEQRYNSKYHRVNTTTLYNSKNIPRRQQSQATLKYKSVCQPSFRLGERSNSHTSNL